MNPLRPAVPLFVAGRERVAAGKNPFRHFALRNATSPEGGGLGKEGKFRPHSSTAGRSQPISGKLYSSAKASPFRERWHGEAVTERVAFGKNPLSLAALDSSPEGRALGKEGKFRPHQSTAGRSLPLSCKLYAFAKASPFRERWHGEAVTERVIPPTAKKPACPLPFYGAGKLAFVFLFRGRAYSSILPKPRPSKSSTRSVRLGATGSALAASRGA